MTKLDSVAIRDYLRRLDRSTHDIPRDRRNELRQEIGQHLSEALPEGASDDEVALALGRLGTPEQIAEAERERLGLVRAPATWGGFFSWAVFGTLAALGLVVFPPLTLLILVGVWALTARRPAFRQAWFGALTGAGAVSLYVASVQRRGPGTVCWHTATTSGCDQYANPWPWLVVGLAMVAVGVYAQVRRIRSNA